MNGDVINPIYTMIEFFVKDPVAQLFLAFAVVVLSVISMLLRAWKIDLTTLLKYRSTLSKTDAVSKHLTELENDEDISTIETLKEKKRALAFQEASSGIYVRAEIRKQFQELRKFDLSLDWKDFKKALPYMIVSDNVVDFRTSWMDWVMVICSVAMGAIFTGTGISLFVILSSVFRSASSTLLSNVTAFVCLILHIGIAVTLWSTMHEIRAARKIEAAFKRMREPIDINTKQELV